jgi:hypothetical protein
MTYTEDGQAPVGMTAMWSANEVLAVASYSGEEGATTLNALSGNDRLFGGDEAAVSTTFKGEIGRASTGALEGKFNFYYPLSFAIGEGSTTVTYDYTEQRITLEDKGDNNFVGDPNAMSKYDVLYTEQAVNPSDGITLKRASAVLRFVLPLPAGAPAIRQIELSATNALFYEKIKLTFMNNGTVWLGGVSSEVNIIRLDVDGDADTSAGRTITAYMLTPGDIMIPQGTVMTVSAIAEDGAAYSYSFSREFATASRMLESGKTYSFAPASPPTFAYRLSNNGTANCYIIGGEGKRYAFDATVRGNGVIINGYFPNGIPATIGQSEEYSASLLWWMSGEPTNVSYDASTGYISFTGIDTTANGASGNAVIALKDGSGEILWSWHIWLIGTPQPDEVYETGIYYNGTVTMMPYNLGSVNTWNFGSAAVTYPFFDGLLYQWGRKDPFLGARWYTDDFNPKKGENFGGVADFTYDGVSPVTPEEAYKHPTTFYKSFNALGDWVGIRYDNLWGNGSGGYAGWDGDNNKAYGVKTLFDPCPPGYKVPPRNTWSANFSNIASLSFDRGYAFKYNGTATTFYPASGFRNIGGRLSYVGSYGYYWSSSPSKYNTIWAGVMYFKERTTIPLDYMGRANGFFVRCAREKNE